MIAPGVPERYRRIADILPHRFPLLLVDRIIEVESGKRAVGVKLVTGNEPYGQCMTGALLVEMMAQVGAVGLLLAEEGKEEGAPGSVPFFRGIIRAQFYRPAVPGETLTATVTMLKTRGALGWASGTVVTERGHLLCEAEFSYTLQSLSTAAEGE